MRSPARWTALSGLAAVFTAALLTPALHAGGIPVTGRVLAPGGAPLAAARVELLPVVDGYRAGKLEMEGKADPEPVATALSNAQGDFRLTAPDIGMWKVAVQVPGHVPMESEPIPLVDEAELSPLELVSSRELTVRVLDSTGRPVAGARVQADLTRSVQAVLDAHQRGWGPARRIAWTGERGEAVLPWTPGEELRLRAFARGFQESGDLLTQESGAVLRLAPAGLLDVELVDAKGKPATGALVSVGEGSWSVGLAGESGRLALPVANGGPVLLTIRTPDGAGEIVELSSEELADRKSPKRISLSPPALLSGRVLRLPDSRPLAGALVWPRSNPAAAVRTDARGGFAMVNLHVGSVTVFSSAPGYLQGWVELAAPANKLGEGDLGKIELQPAGRMEGRVVDENGGPVPDATIRADLEHLRDELPAEAMQAETRTAADGRFRFQRLIPSESYRLTATRTGFATLARTAQAAQGRAAIPIELVLVKGRILAGKVVDEEDRPVAGARVVLERNKAVATGKSGEFEVLNPPTGTHALAVYRPGFAPLLIRRLEIAEKDLRIDLGTLTLRKTAIIEGRVADPEGKPIAGAKVISTALLGILLDRFFREIEENPGIAVTDAEGRFRLRELHPRERVNLYVQRDGYVTAVLGAIRATAGKPLEIVLQPEATISGRVIGEAGESVPNATVRWLPEAPKEGSQDLRGTTATGPDGSFVLKQLDAGPARLIAAAEGRGTAETDLTLDVGQALKDVVLNLRTEGPTLEGRIFDSQGRPLAGASVHVMLIMPLADRGTATTDESGHFRFNGLLLGETTVLASHPGSFRSIQRKVLIQPGRNEIDLAFPPGHPVSGRVVNDQGAPVADASIRIESTDPLKVSCDCTTAADGSFTTCEVPDGAYRIQARAHERGSTPGLPVQVSGRPVTDLELQLQRPGRITGHIRGLEPDQLLWLTLLAIHVKSSDTREGRIGHDGRFEISDLLSGPWELRLWNPRAPAPPPGQRPGTLLGTVTLEPGAAEAQVELEVSGEIDGWEN